MIKIAIIDNQILFREGLKSILNLNESFKIVAEGVSGKEVGVLYKKCSPDVVLMEKNLTDISGIRASEILLNTHPEAKVILITQDENDSYVLQALKAGVCGYMSKNTSAEEIYTIIEHVANGGCYIQPRYTSNFIKEFRELSEKEHRGVFVQEEIRKPYHILSDRECQVLQLLADGQSNRTLAETLYISEKTVKNHVSNILEKMAVNDRTQAVVMAIKNGWVELR